MSKARLVSELSEQHSQHSQKSLPDNDDSQVEESNAPRIDRNLNYDAEFNKIIISTAFTHYPVIRQAATSLGMMVVDEAEECGWDVCWTDHLVTPQTFIRMHFHQTISYVPGVYTIARKNQLGRRLNALKANFPLQYNFHPLTWMLPEDYHLLRKYMEANRNSNETFIVKPEAECQGRGISLVNKLEDITMGKHLVVQKYLNSPFLIDGLKFDLRVYVLIGSIDPLRLYLYKQGLGRFATQTYNAPNKNNFKSNYQHLTNYAINKLNPKFKAALSGAQGQGGFKRSIQVVLKQLRQMGADDELLWQRIKDICVKTVIASYQQIKHYYLSSQPEEYHNRMAFHILGLDILINQYLEPVLLEVNHTPSFATETPLDSRIKFALVRDTLRLMECDSIQLKKTLFAKSKTECANRQQQGKRQIYNQQIRKAQVLKNTQNRLEKEKSLLGGYQVIYPSQDQQKNKKYLTLIEKAKTILYPYIKRTLKKQKTKKEKKSVQKDEKDSEKKQQEEKLSESKRKLSQKQIEIQLFLQNKKRSKQSQKTEIKQRLQQRRAQVKRQYKGQIRNHSMYNQRMKQQSQQILQSLHAFRNQLNVPIAPHTPLLHHPLLAPLPTKHQNIFTIRAKHSQAEIAAYKPLVKQEQVKRVHKERNRVSSSRQAIKNGNFIKPKTYDVLGLLGEQRVVHRKKEPRSIHF